MNGNEYPLSHGLIHRGDTNHYQRKMFCGNTAPPNHYLNESEIPYSFNGQDPVSLLVPVFFAQRPDVAPEFQFAQQHYAPAHAMAKPSSFLEFMGNDVTYPPQFSYSDHVVPTNLHQNVHNDIPPLVRDIPHTATSSPNVMTSYNLPPQPPPQQYPVQSEKYADFSNADSSKTYKASPKIEASAGNKTKQKTVSKCELCSQTFSRPDNLKRHMRNIHTISTSTGYTCHKCGKEIKRHDNLVHHEVQCCGSGEVVEPKRTRHDCTVCSKSYYRKQDLKRHMSVVHTEVKNLFGCTTCNFTTPYKVILKRHCHENHNQFKNLYTCQKCGVNFRTQHAITKHRRSNECATIDQNTCKICLTRFRTIHRLKEHFRSDHSDELLLYLDTGEDTLDCFGAFTRSELKDESSKTPQVVMPSLVMAGTTE